MSQYSNYASQVPKEVRLAINSLSGQDDLRYGIIMALVEAGELQFSELESRMDVHQQSLSNALSDLQTGGFVKKKTGEKIGRRSSGAYTITKFGERILNGLYQASWPKIDRGGISGEKRDLVKSSNVVGATFDMPRVENVKETEKFEVEAAGAVSNPIQK